MSNHEPGIPLPAPLALQRARGPARSLPVRNRIYIQCFVHERPGLLPPGPYDHPSGRHHRFRNIVNHYTSSPHRRGNPHPPSPGSYLYRQCISNRSV